MKNLIIVVVMIMCQQVAFSQISKGDLENLLYELGTSMDKIESLYCSNKLVFYTDGTFKRTYEKFKRNNNEYENTFKLAESGIVVHTKKSGQAFSRKIYAYSSIKFIDVGVNYIEMELRD